MSNAQNTTAQNTTVTSIAESSCINRYTVPHGTEPYEHLLTIKRSEFIGHIKRVTTQDEARAYIESLRKTYHDARHVCSAFVIGANRQVQRSSDDGEPAGTAGIPILQVLLARQIRIDEADLSDVVAVVVRYFGGIKLGAGGLVRAYTDAVVQTLEEARFDVRQSMRVGIVPVSHADAGRLENDVRTCGLNVLGTEYLPDGAEISVGVFDQPEDLARAGQQVVTLTAGRSSIQWGTTSWVDIPLSQ